MGKKGEKKKTKSQECFPGKPTDQLTLAKSEIAWFVAAQELKWRPRKLLSHWNQKTEQNCNRNQKLQQKSI